MTDLATKLAILEAIQADVRGRVDRIVDRLGRGMASGDEAITMGEALRDALGEISVVLAEGIHAQKRERERTSGTEGPS